MSSILVLLVLVVLRKYHSSHVGMTGFISAPSRGADGCTGYEGHVSGNVIELLSSNAEFRDELGTWLHNAAALFGPTASIFWECEPIQHVQPSSLRFCVTHAPVLENQQCDVYTFAQHFERGAPESQGVTFSNLGGDAMLVCPRPQADKDFSDLANWLRATRDDPASSRDPVFQALGRALASRIEAGEKIWMSLSLKSE